MRPTWIKRLEALVREANLTGVQIERLGIIYKTRGSIITDGPTRPWRSGLAFQSRHSYETSHFERIALHRVYNLAE